MEAIGHSKAILAKLCLMSWMIPKKRVCVLVTFTVRLSHDDDYVSCITLLAAQWAVKQGSWRPDESKQMLSKVKVIITSACIITKPWRRSRRREWAK